MSMIFTPVIFGDRQLHAARYTPRGEVRSTVLLITPLFEEKRCAQRAMTICAQALAESGALVLQLDISATGNSAGDLQNISMKDWIADIQQGIHSLRDTYPQKKLALLGCRAGALLLANALTDQFTAERFILWQPILVGGSYLQQLRTRRMIQDNITGDAAPNIGEFEVEGQKTVCGIICGDSAFKNARDIACQPRVTTVAVLI